MGGTQRMYALNICAYKKQGMSEEDYHTYTSEKHAQSLKHLLVEKKIAGYTMQHNTSETKKMMGELFPGFPDAKVADYDLFVQMVFKDPEDFIAMREDPHYKNVVHPDHVHFADGARTTMTCGWFETHVWNGQLA